MPEGRVRMLMSTDSPNWVTSAANNRSSSSRLSEPMAPTNLRAYFAGQCFVVSGAVLLWWWMLCAALQPLFILTAVGPGKQVSSTFTSVIENRTGGYGSLSTDNVYSTFVLEESPRVIVNGSCAVRGIVGCTIACQYLSWG